MPRTIIRGAAVVLVAVLGAALAPFAVAATAGIAIVTQDQTALRAAPRDSAQTNAVLWQGEAVEIRGERMDYLQVYDYRRERAGFVRASQARRFTLNATDAPELLSVVRFLRDAPGAEALGIGFAAAYIQAAPAEVLNSEAGIEALDALGTFADRLARRVSTGNAPSKSAQATLAAHLEVAARHGVNFTSNERDGRMHICYDGDAHRRVLAMRSGPEQRARAVLALTRPECMPGELRPTEKNRMDEWHAEVLDRVEATMLPAYLKNRVLMRRASVWASLAYQRARKGEAADTAAGRALAELAGVDKTELTDDDLLTYNVAVMRVSASRWAATSAPAGRADKKPNVGPHLGPHIVTAAREAGETCILLLDATHDADNPLARRCTYGIVWAGSATLNREGNALVVAVQPTDAWREMWVFRKSKAGWSVGVLPPATTLPDVGYAEFAGWVPGGAQMLVAREARGEGRYKRNFEVVRMDTLAIERQASDPAILGAFQRWQDPVWKQQTLSLR
jgi:hypothetical protein